MTLTEGICKSVSSRMLSKHGKCEQVGAQRQPGTAQGPFLQSDLRGKHLLQKQWTAFLKFTLICSSPRGACQYPARLKTRRNLLL